MGEQNALDQPGTWTIIDFTAPDETAEDLAEAFAAMLSPTGGWYCDFRVGDDHVVIFADKVFRYRHGDPAAAAEARAWGRRTGVPTHQLDWEA